VPNEVLIMDPRLLAQLNFGISPMANPFMARPRVQGMPSNPGVQASAGQHAQLAQVKQPATQEQIYPSFRTNDTDQVRFGGVEKALSPAQLQQIHEMMNPHKINFLA